MRWRHVPATAGWAWARAVIQKLSCHGLIHSALHMSPEPGVFSSPVTVLSLLTLNISCSEDISLSKTPPKLTSYLWEMVLLLSHGCGNPNSRKGSIALYVVLPDDVHQSWWWCAPGDVEGLGREARGELFCHPCCISVPTHVKHPSGRSSPWLCRSIKQELCAGGRRLAGQKHQLCYKIMLMC